MLNESIEFVSICLGGTIDTAREILEEPDIPRWNLMKHYYMDFQSKEIAKQILGFRTVPYYLVFEGDVLTQSSNKIDLDTLPGRIKSTITKPSYVNISSNANDDGHTETIHTSTKISRSSSPSRVFEIEDLDF
jgi:hypothetical protein